MNTVPQRKHERHELIEDSCEGVQGPSWKWLLGVFGCAAGAIIFACVGLIVVDTRSGVDDARSQIATLQKEKVDKAQYERDITDIKNGIGQILTLHLKR